MVQFKVKPNLMEDAENSLRTFSNYISSYTTAIGDVVNLGESQKELRNFKRLQRSSYNDNIRPQLYRGLLTLKAMESLPVENNSSLAQVYNYWAPVLAYYALHGIGLAAISALGMDLPKDNHRKFRAVISNNFVKALLPPPLNITCKGNVLTNDKISFENIDKDPENIVKTHPWQSLSNSDPCDLIAKALLTTRKAELEIRFARERKRDVKKGHKSRNLKMAEKENIANRLHPTTVIDFFYRMRIRSNYDDPEMYIYGQPDPKVAAEHFNKYLKLTRCLAKLFEQIIERKIGHKQWKILNDEFHL